MRHNLILTGDINLLGVTDPSRPFARVQDQLHAADVVCANLECCFYEPDGERSPEDEGFYAPSRRLKRSPSLVCTPWAMPTMSIMAPRRSARRSSA
jgi:hypothetical protein